MPIEITPANTPHLTAAERKELKAQRVAEISIKKATTHVKRKKTAERKRRARRTEVIEKAKMLADPPPVDLVKMFGPSQTALPNEIRPADDIPLLKQYGEEVPDDSFIEELAKQPYFAESLREVITDPKVARFIKLIGQVENKSMSWCAAACGLTRGDLARIWRDGTLAQAFFKIVKRMPTLADKIMDDAHGSSKACPRCDGFGRVDVPQSMREWFDDAETMVCPNCEGRMVVPQVGSSPDRALIWEKIGWAKQKGGVNVNVNMSEHSVDATMSEMEGIEILEHKS